LLHDEVVKMLVDLKAVALDHLYLPVVGTVEFSKVEIWRRFQLILLPSLRGGVLGPQASLPDGVSLWSPAFLDPHVMTHPVRVSIAN